METKNFHSRIQIGTIFRFRRTVLLDRMKRSTDPNSQVIFTPIGIIRSPFTDISGMPVQPVGARGVQGTLEIFSEYVKGLCDLGGFSRIILIYAFHKCTSCQLTVTPFLDTTVHGIFATRAPCRPNAIGLSIVRLVAVNGCEIIIEDVDVLDRTPLLDIKPYVPAFDCYPDEKAGWLTGGKDRSYQRSLTAVSVKKVTDPTGYESISRCPDSGEKIIGLRRASGHK